MSAYTLDTNVLVGLERDLPRDVFSGLWDRMEDLLRTRRATICVDAMTEIKRMSDMLPAWLDEIDASIEEATPEGIAVVRAIRLAHPGWVDGRKNAADPWIIAHAVTTRRTVVSQEHLRGPGVQDANLGLPNVANEHGVTSLRLIELARAEGWTFVQGS